MTTINQEPTMTTPTPPAWLLCDHRDAGLPGCPTCDGRLDPEARRLLAEVGAYAANLLFAVMAAKATLEDQGRIIEQHRDAEAHGPHGIGPWTKIGGPMPEPWPGMGVKVRLPGGRGWTLYQCDPVSVDGVVYALAIGNPEFPTPGATWRLDDAVEVWAGRVCVWRRDA